MAATTNEVATAINSLLTFSSEDQEHILEVIQDFFSYSSVHDPEENFSDDDDEMEVDTGIQ